MDELKIIIDSLQCQLNAIRNLERFVESDKFEEAFKLANEGQRKEMQRLIKCVNKEELEEFCNQVIKFYTSFENYTVTDLRKLARKLGIIDYQSATKPTLIREITTTYKVIEEGKKQNENLQKRHSKTVE